MARFVALADSQLAMHQSTAELLELFAYEHLDPHLQEISKPFHDLANFVAQQQTERDAEQTACLRKLLEAKDNAVRMRIPVGLVHKNQSTLELQTLGELPSRRGI